MNAQFDEAKLTAYALGELDEADRADVERLLDESPDARNEVESIRRVAGMLTEELSAEPTAALNATHLQQIEATLLAGKIRKWASRALAASFLLAVVGLSASYFMPSLSRARDLEGNRSARLNRLGEEMYAHARPESEPDRSIAFAQGEVVPRPSGGAQSLGGGGRDSSISSSGYSVNMSGRSDACLLPGGEHNAIGDNQTMRRVIPLKTLNPDQARQLIVQFRSTSTTTQQPSDSQRENVLWFDARSSKDSTNPQRVRVVGSVPMGGPVLSDLDFEELGALGYVATPRQADDRDESKPFEPWWNQPREGHQPYAENTGEAYARIFDNPFLPAMQNPLSTFSIDVDTASYSNIRRMLTAGQRPPADAVRIEEMINYFSYGYAPPTGEHPFSVNLETASCPWNGEHRLVRVGLKGVEIEPAKRPVCNLVFLIDVSGSMDCPNKLPLVKQALSMLVGQLSPEDRVAMVVYAGASGLALPSTPAGQREKILEGLDRLSAGGSTNGGEGIQLAYQIAEQNRTEGGVNRVILATDGDFNVGITNQKDLTKLITDEAKSGVFLSVLGFGMGNLKDATLEQLADKGNGNYAYIDTFAEAKKVLVDQIGGTLITIAKDVKIQIEFNPAQVAQYRLIGYENRMLAAQDFNDDKKDAGEIGAGHTVTALYEIVPTTATLKGVDELRYQQPAKEQIAASEKPASKETLIVKLRYKQPTGQTSQLLEVPLTDNGQTFESASQDLRFAASVAGFGMLLRCSPHKGDLTYDAAISMAVASMGHDPSGQRSEFIDLVRKAKTISGH
ncbi:hypothetical protein B7486_19205 [cyanobacterium TDX16]|nr:hypothetical protein B7486_19205 [cyanobacterium TDX16]